MTGENWAEATVRMPDPETVTPGQMVAFLRSVFGDGPVLLLKQSAGDQMLADVVGELHSQADILRDTLMGQEASVVRNIAQHINRKFGKE